jgi:outer membrane murein-binding lipoprotein Lpp
MPRATGHRRAAERLLRAAAALVLSGALIAGCGGSDKKDAFSRDFKPVNDQLVAVASSVGQAVASPVPDAVMAGEFQGFATQLQDVKRRIDSLHPPGDLSAQTAALSAAVGRLTADLRAISLAAKNHNPAATRAATQALVSHSQAAGNARRALARKTGANVGP